MDVGRSRDVLADPDRDRRDSWRSFVLTAAPDGPTTNLGGAAPTGLMAEVTASVFVRTVVCDFFMEFKRVDAVRSG